MYTTAYKTKKVTIEQYERLYFFGYFDVKCVPLLSMVTGRLVTGDWEMRFQSLVTSHRWYPFSSGMMH